MKRATNRFRNPSGALALTLLALPTWTAAAHGRPVDVTLAAAPDAIVEIDNTSGSVEVTGWDRNEVRVTGSLGEDVEDFVAEGSERHIVIDVETPDRGGWHRDFDADLRIMVPAGSRLDIETVSASIEAEEISGRVEAESVSGGITVTGSPERVDAETVSGSIRVRGASTPVTAESVSGGVRLEGVAERVEASTVSGRIEVAADAAVERADLESVSGSIEIDCPLGPGARIDAGSHSGNVDLTLSDDVSATFEVSTFSGRIDNELGPPATRSSRFGPGMTLEFTAGSGDGEVSIETFSGSVRLRKR